MTKKNIPAEVNVSSTPYLRLISKCFLIFFGLVGVGYVLSVVSVYFVSLDRERDWFSTSYTADINTADTNDPLTVYLRSMAAEINPEMAESIHVQCDDDFNNAMATLGGQVVFGKALIDDIESENELFFILAHEVGHVQERHVMKQLSFRMPFLLAQMVVGQDITFSSTGNLVGANFSRRYEKSADTYAIAALMKRYGHVGGVDRFFERTQESLDGWQDYLGSHPSHTHRLSVLSEFPEGDTKLFRKNILEKSCVSEDEDLSDTE
jgi:Zn-dependent protease with chaperone function